MKAILSLAPFGFRSFHRAVLYPDSREDVVDAVRVDVKGRRLRPREFWNRATNTLRYVAEDAEAKQVQEAFDGANQDAEPDRLKDDDRRGNRPTSGGGEADQVAEEARGEPAGLGPSEQPRAERSRQEGVAPAKWLTSLRFNSQGTARSDHNGGGSRHCRRGESCARVEGRRGSVLGYSAATTIVTAVQKAGSAPCFPWWRGFGLTNFAYHPLTGRP